jgi:hypothetical protein
LGFLQLAPYAITLENREIVDEELALEMIHLMLQTDGGKTRQLTLEGDAVPVLRSNLDSLSALDIVEETGHR